MQVGLYSGHKTVVFVVVVVVVISILYQLYGLGFTLHFYPCWLSLDLLPPVC